MTQRSARPGMAPSPNQQKVFDALVEMYQFRVRQHVTHIGITIEQVTEYLERHRIGGGYPPNRRPGFDRLPRQHDDGWLPWARSTVRDHLNDLVGKGHVEKKIVGAAHYRPAPKEAE